MALGELQAQEIRHAARRIAADPRKTAMLLGSLAATLRSPADDFNKVDAAMEVLAQLGYEVQP